MTEAIDQIRRQLIELLEAEGAHMSFEAAVADFPAEGINQRVPDSDYTPWHLLEHIRFAQVDILDYIRDRAYLEPTWPDEYWPPRDATATPAEFQATLDAFRRDRAALRDLVADPATDLFAVIPGTPDHSIFREIRIIGAHNAYHIGEFAILRQVMGTWPADRTEWRWPRSRARASTMNGGVRDASTRGRLRAVFASLERAGARLSAPRGVLGAGRCLR